LEIIMREKLQKKRIIEELSELCGGEELPDLFFFEECGSTNTEAKKYAASGVRNAVFVAARQTEGRGRMGRSFLSSEGGLYLSYLFHPDIRPADAVMITVYAAVCLSRIIEELTPVRVGIKWVNDLIVGGKKLAGILTEGAFTEDGERFRYAVVGIGLNVERVGFPPELADIATDIETESGTAPDISLIAALLVRELRKFSEASPADYMDEYRMRSLVKGRRVRVERADKSYFATVLSIGDDASLSVITDEGIEEKLFTGEISIRL
jgi:BirA family biotin operon repressor/biotin-[acetyl-CoA-carboxylase] ligase